jgi:hypothetical protein
VPCHIDAQRLWLHPSKQAFVGDARWSGLEAKS